MKSVYVYPPKQMADAYLSQANPVSDTLYNVLPTTTNVRIYSIAAKINWATTQPTPLDVVVVIDGITIIYQVANPVNGTAYLAIPDKLAVNQVLMPMTGATTSETMQTFLEGRSVSVSIRITWATTQPTPLECRVKYAKY